MTTCDHKIVRTFDGSMKKILFYGAGAVNISLLGWIAREDLEITVLARDATALAIRQHGVMVRCNGMVSKSSPQVVSSLCDLSRPDLIIIGVKAYALRAVVDDIRDTFGKEIPVISVLNGIHHVDLLRSKFMQPMFATICFNAFREEPNTVVAMSRGPIVLTKAGSTSQAIKRGVFEIFKGKVEIIEGRDPMDVACNKLIINLTNALMTMVAFHEYRNRQLTELQYVTSRLLWEGVQVMKASGISEVTVPGVPSWRLFWLSRFLPQFITVHIFKKKMKVSSINSMAQDLQRGSAETELDDINGRLLLMAERADLKVPFNLGLYNLFKTWMESGADPMTPSQVKERIRIAAKKV